MDYKRFSILLNIKFKIMKIIIVCDSAFIGKPHNATKIFKTRAKISCLVIQSGLKRCLTSGTFLCH